MLERIVDEAVNRLDRALLEAQPELRVHEIGVVTHVGGGIARVKGLPGLGYEELVEFPHGLVGIAIDLDLDEVGVVLLGASERLSAGAEARRGGRLADTPVGDALLGRVIDATGRALDDRGTLRGGERRPVERDAPGVLDRAPVAVPLQTGLKAVDALIPIGRGQRELIVGDRQTGKTAVAVDTIINQRGKDVICVYCAIGQRGTAVARVVDSLRRYKAMDYSIVVVAGGDDPAGLRWITPYAATTIAEHFMHQGRDTLVVYDDLTRHARAYRELSLLLRRPPGREAFPGDIFYIHSRMLERATHLHDDLGGGSLTALPIVETQAQDISAFIPTNLISITDGQIYLSPELFHKGLMPAIDIGKSVSRVGGKTQFPTYREVAGDLRLSYSQFEELETFARFATRLDEETRNTIERGRRVREVLKQPEHQPRRISEQIAVMKAVNDGLFDRFPVERIAAAERAVREAVVDRLPETAERIDAGKELDDEQWHRLTEVSSEAVERLEREAQGQGQR